jgi:hypothetical protein
VAAAVGGAATRARRRADGLRCKTCKDRRPDWPVGLVTNKMRIFFKKGIKKIKFEKGVAVGKI